VYHGNGQGAFSLRPRQTQVSAAGVTPIALLGLSDAETEVELRLTGRMPLGRETVKLQWQVAPLGTPFTATTVISGTSSGWANTGLGGVELVEQVAGLVPGIPYHWRARLLYSGNALGLAAGRWVTLPGNGPRETDFRTSGAPPPPPPERRGSYLPIVVKQYGD
jgi:hypothetical protein